MFCRKASCINDCVFFPCFTPARLHVPGIISRKESKSNISPLNSGRWDVACCPNKIWGLQLWSELMWKNETFTGYLINCVISLENLSCGSSYNLLQTVRAMVFLRFHHQRYFNQVEVWTLPHIFQTFCGGSASVYDSVLFRLICLWWSLRWPMDGLKFDHNTYQADTGVHCWLSDCKGLRLCCKKKNLDDHASLCLSVDIEVFVMRICAANYFRWTIPNLHTN